MSRNVSGPESRKWWPNGGSAFGRPLPIRAEFSTYFLQAGPGTDRCKGKSFRGSFRWYSGFNPSFLPFTVLYEFDPLPRSPPSEIAYPMCLFSEYKFYLGKKIEQVVAHQTHSIGSIWSAARLDSSSFSVLFSPSFSAFSSATKTAYNHHLLLNPITFFSSESIRCFQSRTRGDISAFRPHHGHPGHVAEPRFRCDAADNAEHAALDTRRHSRSGVVDFRQE